MHGFPSSFPTADFSSGVLLLCYEAEWTWFAELAGPVTSE